jgi:hypothetical protein
MVNGNEMCVWVKTRTSHMEKLMCSSVRMSMGGTRHRRSAIINIWEKKDVCKLLRMSDVAVRSKFLSDVNPVKLNYNHNNILNMEIAYSVSYICCFFNDDSSTKKFRIYIVVMVRR